MKTVMHDLDAMIAMVLETIPSATVTKVQIYKIDNLQHEDDKGELIAEFSILSRELIATLQMLVRMK